MTSPLQQKVRFAGPMVVTANRLTDGVVVHRGPGGTWVENLADAELLTDASSAKMALELAQGDGQNAVGAYLAPVNANGGFAKPGNLREVIRETGVTFPASWAGTRHGQV
jgi:hypothetical protein